jgi:hypothetical protein
VLVLAATIAQSPQVNGIRVSTSCCAQLSVENLGSSRLQEFEMARILRSAGHGLLAAGVFFLATYLFAIYLNGLDALYEAVNPLRLSTYLLVLLPIMPGTFLLWLSDQLSLRSRKTG